MKKEENNIKEATTKALSKANVMCSALPKCNKCNDTGKIKYKDIEECMYSWQPWLEKDCRCKELY